MTGTNFHRKWFMALALALALLLSGSPGKGSETGPPGVEANFPTGTSVNVTSIVVMTFDCEMNTTSVENAFNITPGVSGNFSWTDDNTSMAFTPNGTLDEGVVYGVRVNGSIAKDIRGNFLDGNGNGTATGSPDDDFTWDFRTRDTSRPYIVETTPSDGGSGVALSLPVIIRFNESMDTSSFTLSVLPYDPGSWHWSWSETIFENDTVTGEHFVFGIDTEFRFQVTGAFNIFGDTVVTNASFNPWNFTTVTIDAEPPKVLESAPAGENVSAHTDIIVSFNKHMNTTAVLNSFSYSDGSENFTSANGTWSWSVGASDGVFTPTDRLRYNSTYTLKFNGSLANDTDGRMLDGNGNGTASGSPADDYIWQFRTEYVAPSSELIPPPARYTNSTFITLNYSATAIEGPLTEIEFWYSFNGGNFTIFDNLTISGLQAYGNFTFNATEGAGNYSFYTRARDTDNWYQPTPPGPYNWTVVDFDPPASHATALPPYKNSRTFDIFYTASDGGSGVFEAVLWYRTDDSNWEAWSASPASVPFNFTGLEGEKYYFHTQAFDRSGNHEQAPNGTTPPDTSTTIDSTPPQSNANALPAITGSLSIIIGYGNASDDLSGVNRVELWFRKDGGSWKKGGTSGLFPNGSIMFPVMAGDGMYEFFTMAIDNAGNYEITPDGGNDAWTHVDTGRPESFAYNAPDYSNTGIWDVNYNSTDGKGMGVVSVELWYRLLGGSWSKVGNSSQASGSFRFGAPDDDGVYELCTRSIDAAGHYEQIPFVADETTRFDSQKPTSEASVASNTSTSGYINVSYIAGDFGDSGVAEVELWAKKDDERWVLDRVVTPSKGTLLFVADFDGKYKFYTRAWDRAENREDAPLFSIDCAVVVDTLVPDVTAHYPSGRGVALPVVINIDFGEEMNVTSAEEALSVVDGSGNAIPGAVTWANGNKTLVFTPEGAISYETVINVTLEKTASDVVGNELSSDYSWSFMVEPDPEIVDTDGDGIPDRQDDDDDGDGIPDALDVLPLDADNDGTPDVNDDDKDGDGINNTDDEYPLDTDNDGVPKHEDDDDDGDGMDDAWEQERLLDPTDASDASLDMDGDGLSNLEEFNKGTNPWSEDTDGDGVSDKEDAFPLDKSKSEAENWLLIGIILAVVAAVVGILLWRRR